jgi:DMSO/TMAO reductase YedYZ molybdopterin-dependent catalytic subunit
MDSVKWLTGVEVVCRPFRGPFQELDYRYQPEGCTGIGDRIDELRVHALITSMADGDKVGCGVVEVSGIAWSGAGVASVELRLDAGPWRAAEVTRSGRWERVRWCAAVELDPGVHTLAVRATDVRGRTQPAVPVWNRRGYVNNSVHRIGLHAVPAC